MGNPEYQCRCGQRTTVTQSWDAPIAESASTRIKFTCQGCGRHYEMVVAATIIEAKPFNLGALPISREQVLRSWAWDIQDSSAVRRVQFQEVMLSGYPPCTETFLDVYLLPHAVRKGTKPELHRITYQGVSREMAHTMVEASSVGRYYNLHIKGKYPAVWRTEPRKDKGRKEERVHG